MVRLLRDSWVWILQHRADLLVLVGLAFVGVTVYRVQPIALPAYLGAITIALGIALDRASKRPKGDT